MGKERTDTHFLEQDKQRIVDPSRATPLLELASLAVAVLHLRDTHQPTYPRAGTLPQPVQTLTGPCGILPCPRNPAPGATLAREPLYRLWSWLWIGAEAESERKANEK